MTPRPQGDALRAGKWRRRSAVPGGPPARRLAAGCRSCSTERQGPGRAGSRLQARAASLAPARATRCGKEVVFEIIYGFYCACPPGLAAPSPHFAARAAWPQLLTAEKRSQIPQGAEETVRRSNVVQKQGKTTLTLAPRTPRPLTSHQPRASFGIESCVSSLGESSVGKTEGFSLNACFSVILLLKPFTVINV